MRSRENPGVVGGRPPGRRGQRAGNRGTARLYNV